MIDVSMLRFIPLVLKTLWRHRSRTLLTVAGSATALFVMSFVAAVNDGMNVLCQQRSARESLIVFQANKFCPASSHLPQDYERRIEELSAVRQAVPIQVFTNNCRASLDVVVFYGVQAAELQEARTFELVSGSWKEFEANQDSGIVGESLAGRRGLKVGQKFSIGEITVTIAGIFRSTDAAEENYVYAHLPFLQRAQSRDLAGTATQIEVLLKPDTDAALVCKQIDDLFRNGPTQTQTRPKGIFQARSLGDLVEMISMARYLGYACVGLVLVLVATTTLMSVQDRIREHAVLHTLGFSSGRVFLLVMLESTILSVTGGLTGIGCAMLFLKFGALSVGAEAVTIAFLPSLGAAYRGLLVSVFAGLMAGVIPAVQAARVDIVPALRHRG